MANPLKVLVDLQARRNVAVSGTLEVTGSTALVGNTTVTSLTASSVISGTQGYFTGLFINGAAVSTGGGGGSGTVNTGSINKLAFYPSNGTTVDDAVGLTYSSDKLTVSGSSSSALALEVTGAISATGVLSSTGVTVTGNISGSGTLQAGGALTVAGASALNGGLTSTTISGSGALQVGSSATIANGLTVSAGTSAVQALTATTISGSSTLQAGGALTVAGLSTLNGGLTVTGGAVNASAVELTASALSVTNAATIGGSLTVTGDLTVNGTTTTINSVTMSVDDKNIILAATLNASDASADGGGITLSGSTDKTFNWINSNGGKWTSSENLDLASGKTYKINAADVLSSTTLGTTVVASSLTSVGILTSLSASGHTAISTLSASAISGTAGTFTSLTVNAATVATQTAVTTAVQDAYRKVRHVATGSLDGSTTVDFDLTAVDGTAFAVGQKDYISVNVVVRSGSLGSWQNDLVAVHLSGNTAGNGGDNKLHILIDALGSDVTHYRLIAVNESDSAFSVTF